MVYPALLPLMRTSLPPLVDRTDDPAYLNELVRCAERRNVVSAHVPSHFKRSLLATILSNMFMCEISEHWNVGWNIFISSMMATLNYACNMKYQWSYFKKMLTVKMSLPSKKIRYTKKKKPNNDDIFTLTILILALQFPFSFLPLLIVLNHTAQSGWREVQMAFKFCTSKYQFNSMPWQFVILSYQAKISPI